MCSIALDVHGASGQELLELATASKKKNERTSSTTFSLEIEYKFFKICASLWYVHYFFLVQ